MSAQELKTRPQQLHCSVHMDQQTEDSVETSWFVVEICGSILSSGERRNAILKVTIDDVTDGIAKIQPVLEKRRRRGLAQAPVFSHQSILGEIDGETSIEDWTTVARLECDWLLFARKGRRSLLFQVEIISSPDNTVLSSVRYLLDYQNPKFGYVDIKENLQQARVLGLGLSAGLACNDMRYNDRQVGLMRGWALADIKLQSVSLKSKRNFEKSFQKMLKMVHKHGQVPLKAVSKKLAEIAPPAIRYDVLQLTLELLSFSPLIDVEQLRQLNDVATWLEVDGDRFRTMLSKVLPVAQHTVVDTGVLLGITEEMSPKQIRQQLNKEYAKWNSRVTNPDPKIKAQADQMLELIAATRAQYE